MDTVKQVYDVSLAQSRPIQRDAWGVLTGAANTSIGFTGEWTDTNTNLVFLHARWYNPSSGTFLGRDPFAGYPTQPYSLHPYQYGYASPLLNTDHSGRCLEPLTFAICALGVGMFAGMVYGVYEQATDATPGIDANVVARYSVGAGLVGGGGAGLVALLGPASIYAMFGAGFIGSSIHQGVAPWDCQFDWLHALSTATTLAMAQTGIVVAYEIAMSYGAYRIVKNSQPSASSNPAQLVLDQRIQNALNSGSKEIQLEGRVAQALRPRVIEFQKTYFHNGNKFTEVDIETDMYLIEVTQGKGGKLDQVKAYQSLLVNPTSKPVIVYAPEWGKFAQRDVEAQGAIVIKKWQELIDFVMK